MQAAMGPLLPPVVPVHLVTGAATLQGVAKEAAKRFPKVSGRRTHLVHPFHWRRRLVVERSVVWSVAVVERWVANVGAAEEVSSAAVEGMAAAAVGSGGPAAEWCSRECNRYH
jgi:hypothetical protein